MGPKQLHSTAILIFARSSTEEMRHKKLPKGRSLFNALTEHTVKTVGQTGMPYFHVSEEAQIGNAFGERFTNAIQSIFDKGYENIITVGNDSPHLTAAHFEETLSNLKVGKSVLGPSVDGGFYLMGLHRSNFEKFDFEKLSWQTSHIREEIIKLLAVGTKEIHLLPNLFDIDTFWDVQIIAKHAYGLSQKVLTIIQKIVPSDIKIDTYTFLITKGVHSQIPFNKGSPSLLIF